MPVPRAIVPMLALAVAAGAAAAQESLPDTPLEFGTPAGPGGVAPDEWSPIVTVDSARLFSQSAWGLRVLAELEAEQAALEAKTRKIEQELIAEEQELTRLRPEMDPVEFRRRASQFDKKVQRLRAETDSQSDALTGRLDTERQRFLGQAVGVLAQIVRDRGAVAIIDNSAIVLSVADIDITDAAIARVDSDLGDGASP